MFSKELQEAIYIAQKAGEQIMKHYKNDYQIWEKGENDDKTPVTQADIEANDIIEKYFKEKFSYPILSEETQDTLSRMKSDKLWIIDPIDGTKAFIQNKDHFSVIIGLANKVNPILGVVYFPAKDTLYFAEKNKGAFKKFSSNEPYKIQVSDRKEIESMKLAINLKKPNTKTEKLIHHLNIKHIDNDIHGMGNKIALIADGTYDLFLTAIDKISEWDTCGSEILLSEAGGYTSDLKGNPLLYNQKNVLRLEGIVASNGHTHKDIIDKIQMFEE